MITRISNVHVVDAASNPARGGKPNGEVWFEDGRIIRPAVGIAPDREIDGGGAYAMAGGIDLHTHIGGGKLALARMLTEERFYTDRGSPTRPYLPQAGETGRRYLEMGYTAAFEPAMLPSGARATHWELSDVAGLETGGYVVLGNEPPLLRMIAAGASVEQVADYVALMVATTGALAVKVVNPGGIDAFKYNRRSLDVDQLHPHYGVTPRQIIASLTAAIDHLRLPHPLHVHASNLGAAGSVKSLLATMDAADGHRIHLTHIQFHSYGNGGAQGFSSAAADVARYVNTHPNVSVDVGQVVFGKTCLLSADVMRLDVIRKQTDARRYVCGLLENESGCGVIPFEYKDSHFVHALQWLIGLELLLLIEDPWRIFLTTDHPNGGPFTSYPYLIRLLMDRTFREAEISRLPADAIAASDVRGLSRQYSLEEIAIMTRSAPAQALGLTHRGTLAENSTADIVLYEHQADWQQTFTRPRAVIVAGHELIANGRWQADPPLEGLSSRLVANIAPTAAAARLSETLFQEQYGLAASQFVISRNELADIACGRLRWIETH